MKRIDAITRCKGIVTEMLNRKGARILRQVDQAIDMAKDNALLASEKADEMMSSFGSVAESSQTGELCSKINKYKDLVIESRDWAEVAEILQELKAKLNEDVEVEEK